MNQNTCNRHNFFPVYGSDMQVCGLNDVKCLAENSKYWRQLALPPQDLKVELDAAGLSCSCPSGCFELTYSVETSYADYPSVVAESKVI